MDAVTDGMPHDATFLSTVLRDAPLPLWVIDGRGRVALANDAAARFLGHRHGTDLLGGASHDLLHRHRPDGSPYPKHECPIIHAKQPVAASEWFVTQAGDVRPVRWSTRPLAGTDNVLLSFAALSGPAGGAAGLAPAPRETRAQTRARLLHEMKRSIASRMTDPLFSTTTLAADAHLSVRSVQAIFAEAGTSPAAEIRRHRLEHARVLLEQGESVQWACHASGFLDADSFARAYRQHFGFAPSRTREP
ncbi:MULTISPECIES: AraC family transcriptional regulator [Microbacterium]|uniref:helix-turn-helix transcriptional regulator n=1 Tax=Microbacterium TaxID=33882 RepID=UPI002787F724|nr:MULTISPECIES: helix-turn-helix domain-containing protein [Microbacterium]MDQ1082562.1 PAS domain S-box-containing protein [Microbacterium sp. SORGH_AS_0344]MDQ1168666.1 PAS domain S-box-containing protein [Microbacterium proteolyticum]